MTDLATRLEAATEGSRELSDLVIRLFGFRQSLGNVWLDSENIVYRAAPDPARSVDDGLALLRETGCWRLDELHEDDEGQFSCALILRRDPDISVTNERPTDKPALAIAAALVRTTSAANG